MNHETPKAKQARIFKLQKLKFMSTTPKTKKIEYKNLVFFYWNEIANQQKALEYRPFTSSSVIHRYRHPWWHHLIMQSQCQPFAFGSLPPCCFVCILHGFRFPCCCCGSNFYVKVSNLPGFWNMQGILQWLEIHPVKHAMQFSGCSR